MKVPDEGLERAHSPAAKMNSSVLAALRTLSAHGDTELVSVKDEENTVPSGSIPRIPAD